MFKRKKPGDLEKLKSLVTYIKDSEHIGVKDAYYVGRQAAYNNVLVLIDQLLEGR